MKLIVLLGNESISTCSTTCFGYLFIRLYDYIFFVNVFVSIDFCMC